MDALTPPLNDPGSRPSVVVVIRVRWKQILGAACGSAFALLALSALSVGTTRLSALAYVGIALGVGLAVLFGARLYRTAIVVDNSGIVLRRLFRTTRIAPGGVSSVSVGQRASIVPRLFLVFHLGDGSSIAMPDVFLWATSTRSRQRVEAWATKVEGATRSADTE
jgi:hypothetical protein